MPKKGDCLKVTKLARTNILKIINAKMDKPISLTAFNYFIFNDDELNNVLKANKLK